MKKLFAMLLMIGSLMLVGCGGSGPGDTVKKFAYAMEDGDVKKVNEAFPALASTMGNEKVEKMVKDGSEKIKQDGGIKSVTIDKEEIKENSATVTATIESGKGEKDTQEFSLSKVDGKWVITLGDQNKAGGGLGGGGLDFSEPQ